jgi:AsmA-like C-terminal region
MIALLFFFSTAIGAYWWFTDPTRIRTMAESYLTDLIGGHVHVGEASLSVFEGLKLTNVTLKVDDANAPDSVLFVADAFDIQYDPAALLRGDLQATRIIVTGPQVHLVENVDKGRWNYQRLLSQGTSRPIGPESPAPSTAPTPPPLPEIVLRDAEVKYSEIRGGHFTGLGMMAIEGRLSPSLDGSRYSFELQSRGAVEGVGPVVSGNARLDSGQVVAALTNFRFGRDIEAVLPSEVRDWWEAHQLEGALNIPEFRYTPASPNHRATFRMQTQLQHVRLVVRPQELAGSEGAQRLDTRQAVVDLLHKTGADLLGRAAQWKQITVAEPIAVEDVSGNFVFDDNGITFDKLLGKMEGNTVAINGRVTGYSPDAPFHIQIGSLSGQLVHVPKVLKEADALPDDPRNLYNALKPHGTCTLSLSIDRPTPGSRPELSGDINVVDGSMSCFFFPYPLDGISGKITFTPQSQGGFEHVTIENMKGHGAFGTANEKAVITLDGWVGPFDNTVGCNLRVRGHGVSSDRLLYLAFPPPVRDAMGIFHEGGSPTTEPTSLADETFADYPTFNGDFDCNVIVPIGPTPNPIVNVDITLADANGKLAAFPYPLRHLSGVVKVRNDHVELVNVAMKRGDASLLINGRVDWPVTDGPINNADIKPDLTIHAVNVPIDQELLTSLPNDKQTWLKKTGLTGTVDLDGHLFHPTDPATATMIDGQFPIGYSLDIKMHDGSIWPSGKNFAATGITGRMQLTPNKLDLNDVQFKRGNADITAKGSIELTGDSPQICFNAHAKGLAMDDSLYQMLPTSAQGVWDSIDPHGTLDADLDYNGPCTFSDTTTQPVTLTSTTAPSAGNYTLTLEPRDMTVTPKVLPYRLDNCTGKVVVKPSGVVLNDLVAKHGDATIKVSGTGPAGGPDNWSLALLVAGVPIDSDFKKALPPAVDHLIDGLGIKGKLTLELKNLSYRANADPNATPDIVMSGVLHAKGDSMEVGVPMSDIIGSMSFDAAIHNGSLDTFKGHVDFDSLQMAQRPMKNLKADLEKPAGAGTLYIRNIQSELAGGQLAGNVNLLFPDQGDSTYSLDLEVKNADVGTIGKLGPDIRGQLSASLALEGDWSDPSVRRGRGDVLVTGKSMYQIPLVLGLFEVTNLSLPNTSPFNEATARYAVEGQRVTFDQIQMRSDSMVMNGNGWMDFGSKQVRMNFSTANPNMPQVPFIHDLWQGATQELFQIQVRGSIQSPKVSGASMHTFTTTVDEVFTGNGKEK